MVIIEDSNDGYASMTTYMVFDISTNLGTFVYIVWFGLYTENDNIWDYIGLYMEDPFQALYSSLGLLSMGGLPPLVGFFRNLYLFWCGWQAGPYFFVLVGPLTSILSWMVWLFVDV